MSAQMSFWERRRAAVQAETEADAQALLADEAALSEKETADKTDEVILQELGLPDPDTLEPGSDFSAFMVREVPRHLRNKALRVLWRSNPVLACVDGLNDYDGDFRTDAASSEPIKTAYKVGKGMLAHIEEMARQQEAAELAATQPDGDLQTSDDLARTETTARPDMSEPSCTVAEESSDDEGEATAVPRRMRFRFEEVTT